MRTGAYNSEQVFAATSSNLNFQGRLLSSNGNVVPDGYYNLEFKLFNASSSSGSSQGSCSGDANCLWTETRDYPGTDDRVRTVNGYFSVNLGSVTTLPDINWDQDLWLSMNVGGSGTSPTWDGQMSPKIKLTSVPFAQAAKNVYSGNTNSASTDSDNVSIRTGNATGATSDSGNINIDVGTATGTAGTISVGTANTSGITIGYVGVLTDIGGDLTVSGSQFTNNGSTLNTALNLGNFASGGSVGSAASTVDSHTSIAIAQTTAGQVLSLPTPTDTAAGRMTFVFNTGSVSFTMHSITIPAGYGQIYVWNGSAWILGASGGGSAITLQSAYDGGNTLATSNGRDVDITLANTASDANFTIDIATGSTGEFQVQSNSTNILQVGSTGLTVTGVTANINVSGTANTSIGNATGTLTLTGSNSSTIVLNGITITATELNRLDGKDAALIDINDAVSTAIIGTGALDSGSITSGFGAIDTGADSITTTGTITGGTVNATTGINTGAGAGTQRIDSSGNLVAIGNLTTTGASTFTATGANGFTFKPGTDNTGAFLIQNAGGTALFRADTTNSDIIVENATLKTSYIDSQAGSSSTISRTNRTSASSSTGIGTASYTPGGTFTPNANRILIAYVFWESDNQPMATDGSDVTVTGGSLSWTPITGQFHRNTGWGVGHRAFYAYTTGSPPSNMQVTADAGAEDVERYHVVVDEMDGVSSVTPVAGAMSDFRQSNDNNTWTDDLAATPLTDDWKVLVGSLEEDLGSHIWDTPAGWTEIHSRGLTPDSTVMYDTGSTTTTLNYDLNNIDYSNADTTYGGFILKAQATASAINIGATTATEINIGNSGSGILLSTGSSGVTVQGSNSATAFVIQDSGASNDLFTADTSNNRILIGDGDDTSSANTTLLVLDSASTANAPAGADGGMFYDTTLDKFRCYENGSYVNCVGASNLQGAYDGGGTITTANNKDLAVTLANTATDSNFRINIATSSTSEFQVESNGTDILQIGAAGQLQLDVQGNTGGILLGTDVNLYDGGTNILQTDDAFTAGGLLTGSAGANISGATINLNASSNFATNINTGTSSGAVSIGNSAAGAINIESGSGSGITLNSPINTLLGLTAVDRAGTSTVAFRVRDTSGGVDYLRVDSTNSAVIVNNKVQTADFTGGGNSSSLTVRTGNAASGNSGSLTLDTGTASGTSGNISIGTGSFAHNTTIGNTNANSSVTVQAGSSAAINLNAATVATNATSFNLFNTTATTINFGGGATTALNIGPGSNTATSINLAGGSGNTGCTVDGVTGSFTCSGNISTTGSATITSAGLLTGNAGLAISGATANINTSGSSATSIGNVTGTLTLTGNDLSTIVLDGATITAIELNRLDGKDAALIDTNDAVATAITGTGVLNAGSITSGFGPIDVGTDAITTTGTITGGTVNATTGINTGAGAGAQRIDSSGNLVAIGNITGSSAITLASGGTAQNLILNGSTSGQVLIGGVSTGDVLLAGGSGAGTGCTITNSNGNLTCTGSITTTSISGTQGWWSRSGTTLQPATAGDDISTSGGILTTGSGTITSAGLLTGSAGASIAGNTVSLNASSNFATNINTGTSTGAVNIGNALAGAITLNSSAASSFTTAAGNLTLQAGSGTISLGSSNTVSNSGALAITSGSTLTLQSTTSSAVTLDSGTTGAINIGTNTNAKTITIGNGAGATSVVINAGTGAINIGTNGVARTITVGNATGASSVVIDCGTGACNFGTTATAHVTTVGSVNGASSTVLQAGTGGLTIGGGGIANTLQVGNLSGSVTQNINIGTNNTASSTSNVTIGSLIGGTARLQSSQVNFSLSGGTAIAKSLTNNTGAFQVQGTGSTPVFNVDTVNNRVGINTGSPGATLEVNSGVADTSGLRFTNLSSSSPSSGSFTNILGLDANGNVGVSSVAVSLTSPALAYWDGLNNPTVTGQSYPLSALAGNATYIDAANGIRLTSNGGSQSGRVNWNFSQVPFEHIQFQMKSGGGTGADGTWFYSYADGQPTNEYGSGISEGYIIYFSEYHDCVGITYGGYTDGNQCGSGGGANPLTSAAKANIDDNAWHDVDIIILYNKIIVRWDGQVILTYNDVYTRDTSNLNFGFGARTGGSNNNHYIKGLLVTKLGTNVSEYDITDISPLASDLYWSNTNNRLGIGVETPTRTLDVEGDWGGNASTTVTQNSATTSTISTRALAYYLETQDSSGSSCAQANKTFNITGLSNTEGSYAFISTRATDAGCTGTQTITATTQINGTTIGTVTVTGSNGSNPSAIENYTVVYMNGGWRIVGLNSGTAQGANGSDTADFAEWIRYAGDNQPQPGDVLSVDDAGNAVIASDRSYDKRIIGVVSTTPYQVAGADDGHSVILALTGRVPVKVSLENGPIAPGDPLTSSSVPGVAMKATRPGKIIGTALSAYDGSQADAQVTVQLQAGFNDPYADNESFSIDENGNVVLKNVADSESALSVQNAAGEKVFNVNTQNGNSSFKNDIEVNGNATIQGTVYTDNVHANNGLVLDGGVGGVQINIDGNSSGGGTFSINSGLGPDLLSLTSQGFATFRGGLNSQAAFQIQNASGISLFQIDTQNNRVYIGNSTPDDVGTLLVLDTKNTPGDPDGVAGAMYFNSAMSSFRCYDGMSWSNCGKLPKSGYFSDSTDDHLDDTKLNLWNSDDDYPNLTLANQNNSIIISVAIIGLSNGTDSEYNMFTIHRAIGEDPDCEDTQVGIAFGGFTNSNGAPLIASATFQDNPDDTGNVRYTICHNGEEAFSSSGPGTIDNDVKGITITLQESEGSN